MFLFLQEEKCIFHHFFHQSCLLLCCAANSHSATQEASSTAPSSSSSPLLPPFSLSLLLGCPWWKLLKGQGSMEQCGEVIIHTAFLFSFSLSLPSSTVILNTQPNIAGECGCPLFLNLVSRRVTIFPDTRMVKMRKT